VLGRSVDVIVRENEIRGLSAADLRRKRGPAPIQFPRLPEITSHHCHRPQRGGSESARAGAFRAHDPEWKLNVSGTKFRDGAARCTPQFVRVEAPTGRRTAHRRLSAAAGGQAARYSNARWPAHC